MKKAIFSVLFTATSLLHLSTINAQTQITFPEAISTACSHGDYSYSVKTRIIITGIYVKTPYWDSPSDNVGSFPFDVYFTYENEITGNVPTNTNNFYNYNVSLYTGNTNINSAYITNNIPNVPLISHTEENVVIGNNPHYNGSLKRLGLAPNTMYTSQDVIDLFGYDSATLEINAPCLQTILIPSINLTNEPLPVTLNNFSATAFANTITIKWTTVSEKENDYFGLEISDNAIDWTNIATLQSKAKDGKSDLSINYTYIHNQPYHGQNFYRLKQYDLDGSVHYSKTISIYVNKLRNEPPMAIYPNPAKNILFIQNIPENSQITIFDITGKQVLQSTVSASGINISSLKNGVYMVVFNSAEIHQNFKLSVSK